VTTLGVFQIHLSVLLPCEWWGGGVLNHSNIEAVLIKRQPGDSPRTTKPKPSNLAIIKDNQSYGMLSLAKLDPSIIY